MDFLKIKHHTDFESKTNWNNVQASPVTPATCFQFRVPAPKAAPAITPADKVLIYNHFKRTIVTKIHSSALSTGHELSTNPYRDGKMPDKMDLLHSIWQLWLFSIIMVIGWELQTYTIWSTTFIAILFYMESHIIKWKKASIYWLTQSFRRRYLCIPQWEKENIAANSPRIMRNSRIT